MVSAVVKFSECSEQMEKSLIVSDPQKVNILIVDDLPEKILVYQTILEDLNQNLITARSGEEALRLVLQNEFAVILLDVNMPGMDGFETATLIRKRKKSSRTPIIFLTAFTDELNIAQAYASGAVDYLPTPVVPDVLKAKIKVFIELFQIRQQVAMQAEEKARRTAAEESDRRKDEFLATLAHELRNPLAPLRNALHILQSPEVKPETVKTAYQMMDRQLAQMVRLVDDLMDVSRITTGKIDLRMENIIISEAIESALETSKPLIHERAHRLNIKIPKEPIKIKADMVRLSQIFANLLNNAAKYTEKGGTISVHVEQKNKIVTVFIHDTGIGIPQEKLDSVFDLFMQVDSSLTRAQGGLGIGLTLVKSLVDLQGGQVNARSDGLNKGSTFAVSFPVIKEVIHHAKSNDALPLEGRNRQRRILVVDDNKDSAKTMGWMLEFMGHEITLAHDGKEAIKQALEIKPDFIFLDIGLPGLSGYEICQILKEDPSLEKTIMVAQTGWSQMEHRRKSKEAGFDHHLVKPVRAEDLSSILETSF